MFKQIFLGSLVGHLALFSLSGLMPDAPQFSVRQGVNTIDVVILENKEERKETPKQAILTSDSETTEAAQVPKEKKLIKEKPKNEKTIVSHSEARAIYKNDPIYLTNPAPLYPPFAREQGWQGTVILKVLVQKDGSVAEISVEKSSGYRILDQSALKTVKKWHFRAAHVGNFALTSRIKLPIRFMLVDENKKQN